MTDDRPLTAKTSALTWDARGRELATALHRETWLSHGVPKDALCSYCVATVFRLMAAGILDTARASDTALDAGLSFATFAAVNRARCESPDGFGHPLNGWTLSDWMLAATGEFGEAANKVKKLNRFRDGIPGNAETEDELRAGFADEIADAVIYLDLIAQRAGFTLAEAVISKFNRTSEKIGAPHRLVALPTGTR